MVRMLLTVRPLLVATLILGSAGASSAETALNLESETVPAEQLVRVVPRDSPFGALIDPKVIPASGATLEEDQLVVGVLVDGQPRAYPLDILSRHEIVNDRVGEVPILVWFCNACGSALVFDRQLPDFDLVFRDSGMLFRADPLLVDHKTGGLWSTYLAEALTGPLEGVHLVSVPYRILPWGSWKQRHANTTVISTAGLAEHASTAPARHTTDLAGLATWPRAGSFYHPRMPTVGITIGDRHRAYPAGEILAAGGAIEEEIDGTKLKIAYSTTDQKFDVKAQKAVTPFQGGWEEWYTRHPKTSIFRASGSDAGPGQPEAH